MSQVTAEFSLLIQNFYKTTKCFTMLYLLLVESVLQDYLFWQKSEYDSGTLINSISSSS